MIYTNEIVLNAPHLENQCRGKYNKIEGKSSICWNVVTDSPYIRGFLAYNPASPSTSFDLPSSALSSLGLAPAGRRPQAPKDDGVDGDHEVGKHQEFPSSHHGSAIAMGESFALITKHPAVVGAESGAYRMW
jgi:hypothetical protein